MSQAQARRDSAQSPDVARLVRLHHRRRGWAWVATGSVIGLAVYAGIDVSVFGSLAGTSGAVSLIPLVVLLALALAGIVVVIVDTSLIHRADAAARVSAKGSVSHHPLYTHAHRFPPRHPASWIAGIFMLIAMTCITAYFLPAQVNSWAYVVGAENQDTFNPVSYDQNCTMSSRALHCNSVTAGYLSRSGSQVYWGPRVPLGHPFSVRDPLWAWGTGRNLISGDGSAIPDIFAGLFFDGVALLLLYVLIVLAREASPRRSLRRSVPASGEPDGVRRTQHHDRDHHRNGGGRSTRRKRARR